MRQLVNRGCCGLTMGFTRSHCLPPYNPLGSTTQAQGAHAPVAPQTPTGLTHPKTRRDVWTPKTPLTPRYTCGMGINPKWSHPAAQPHARPRALTPRTRTPQGPPTPSHRMRAAHGPSRAARSSSSRTRGPMAAAARSRPRSQPPAPPRPRPPLCSRGPGPGQLTARGGARASRDGGRRGGGHRSGPPPRDSARTGMGNQQGGAGTRLVLVLFFFFFPILFFAFFFF